MGLGRAQRSTTSAGPATRRPRHRGEPRSNVGLELIEEWEASLEAEAELDSEEARELEEEDMEDQ